MRRGIIRRPNWIQTVYIEAITENKHFFDGKLIGETLDDLCEGRCSIRSIPTISVVILDGGYFTLDNRRLWVFRHLERLGVCDEISVMLKTSIPPEKLTTTNGGRSVRVRGDPGGIWHKKTSYDYATRKSSSRSGWNSGLYSHQQRQNDDFWDTGFITPRSRSQVYNAEESQRKENDSWCTIL